MNGLDGLDELFGAMPQEIVERMGRMSGLAHRAVPAYIEAGPALVPARVGRWRLKAWTDERR